MGNVPHITLTLTVYGTRSVYCNFIRCHNTCYYVRISTTFNRHQHAVLINSLHQERHITENDANIVARIDTKLWHSVMNT